MKIALLTEIVNRKSGSRAPLEIAKALKREGAEVFLFAYTKNLEPEALKELEKVHIEVFTTHSRFSAPFFIYKKLRLVNLDLVSFHGTFPFFLGAKLSGVPIIRTYYGTQFNPLRDNFFLNSPNLLLTIANKIVNLVMLLKEKFLLFFSDEVIAISKYTQRELSKLYDVKAQLVYLGVYSGTFRLKPKKIYKEIRILSVSRIVPYKGFHRLINVFTKLSQEYPYLKLTIVGSSPNAEYFSYLKSIADQKVEILISISDKELKDQYLRADIYASFDTYMFFGMPILEAAVFGKPSVVFDYAASREMIKHETTGFVAKSEMEFEKYLSHLIKNKKLRNRMGKNAREWVENFSWQKTASGYEKVFKKLLQ